MSAAGNSVRFREVRSDVSFLQQRKCALWRGRRDGPIPEIAALPGAPKTG